MCNIAHTFVFTFTQTVFAMCYIGSLLRTYNVFYGNLGVP